MRRELALGRRTKGVAGEDVILSSAPIGQEFVVYATTSSERPAVSSCLRTVLKGGALVQQAGGGAAGAVPRPVIEPGVEPLAGEDADLALVRGSMPI